MFFSTPLDPAHNPFRWDASLQRRFVENLADSGSINMACAAVSKSRVAAYALRKRQGSVAFRIGWDAAILIARDIQVTQFLEIAMTSTEQEGWRHPQSGRLYWRNTNPLLTRGRGVAQLGRLDRAADAIMRDAQAYRLAMAAQNDFECFLDVIASGDPTELSRFLRDMANPELQPLLCKLGRDSAISVKER